MIHLAFALLGGVVFGGLTYLYVKWAYKGDGE